MKDDTRFQKPWEAEPLFREQYLRLIAELLLPIRGELVSKQEPEKGDGKWGLGCCAYERMVHLLTALAMKGAYPWFSLIRRGNEIAPAINGCPIRIYGGDSEHPSSRQLERAREQLNLSDEWQRRDPSWLWFFAVESDFRGAALRVVVVQANQENETRYRWIAAGDGAEAQAQPKADVPPSRIRPLSYEKRVTNAPPIKIDRLPLPENKKEKK